MTRDELMLFAKLVQQSMRIADELESLRQLAEVWTAKMVAETLDAMKDQMPPDEPPPPPPPPFQGPFSNN